MTHIPDAGEAYNNGQPSPQAIYDLIRSLAVRTGRIDPDWDLTAYPKVFWDDAIDTFNSPVLSSVGYPYITTYFPRGNDSIAAIPTQGSYLILGPIGNPGANAPNANTVVSSTYAGTSETNLTVNLIAGKTLSTQTGLSYQPGTRMRLWSRGSGAYMEGLVTAYNGGPVLTFDPDLAVGAGAHTDWNLGVAGDKGATGADGISVTGASIDGSGNLHIVLSDGANLNLGHVVGTDGTNGISVTGANVDGSGNLIITLSSGGPINAGHVVGADGAAGGRAYFGAGNPNTNPPTGSPQSGDVYFRTGGTKGIFIYGSPVAGTWNDTGVSTV